MTENKALKRAIRKRMSETGEPYNTARRIVLAQHQASASVSVSETGAAPLRRVAKSPYVGGLTRLVNSPALKYLGQVQARNTQLQKIASSPFAEAAKAMRIQGSSPFAEAAKAMRIQGSSPFAEAAKAMRAQGSSPFAEAAKAMRTQGSSPFAEAAKAMRAQAPTFRFRLEDLDGDC